MLWQGLVVSDFVQPFGYFTGTISVKRADGIVQPFELVKAWGVVESHYAKW